ncbi:MAG: sulfatase-like hydrolase/transferase, partial [Candidatus Hydrogenedentes bacterium]|nr:sulfatase-like hydrolase/transferase [Candidatus Hydrogenedentota bacterium]
HAGKFHVAPKETFAFEEFFNFEFKDHKTSIDMAEAIQPVIEKEDNRPFFLYFCTREPHRPFQRSHADPVNPGEVRVPPFLPDTDECRKELAEYYMSCHEADLALGKVLDAIKASGHWDDTVIIWIADNGLPFPGAKTSLYEPGVRLPCVIRHPELTRKNATNQAMINWSDLPPTLLDIAHATPEKAQYHGRSLLPILETESPGGWDEVYFSHTFHEVTMYYPVRGYRDRRYKFLWNLAHPLEFPFARDLWDSETWQGVLKRGDTHYGNRSVEALLHRPEFELYDLEQDPWETTNLALQEEFKSHATSFHQKVREFQERTEDPWVIKWKHE